MSQITSSNYIPSNYYLRASGIFAALAFFSLLACVGRNYYLHQGPTEPCTNAAPLLPEESTVQDDEGTLRIVRVPKGEIAVGQPVCAVVAGVAPALGAERLADEVDHAKRAYETKKGELFEATKNSNAAATHAAEAKVKAHQSELNKAATAADDKKAAEQADTDAATSSSVEQQLLAAYKQVDAEYKAAVTAFAEGLPPVELTPFLDHHRATQGIKVQASPKQQAISFDFGSPNSTPEIAKFWQDVLSGGTHNGSGKKQFMLGLARNGSENSETRDNNSVVTVRIYDGWSLGTGMAAVLFLIASIVLLATQTTLLRNNASLITGVDIQESKDALNVAKLDAATKQVTGDQVKAAIAVKAAEANLIADYKEGRPNGAWSLGRVQMAIWMVIVLAGFLFFWLTFGEYKNVVNLSILTLLGLNSATGLLAVSIEGVRNDAAKSRSFFSDILNDGDGPQLQRIQVILWTVVLAVIFLWNIGYNFIFTEFDTYLLLLMGIAQSTYLGFKPNEASKAEPKPTSVTPPPTVIKDQPQPYTIAGAGLAGVTKVEAVAPDGKTTVPGAELRATDNAITIKLTLPQSGDWKVRIASGSSASVDVPGGINVP
jgi:hypothetical protein